jgi:hypothetical protein
LDKFSCKFSNSKKRNRKAGTQASALAFGGETPGGKTAATEEFTITGTKGIKTITVS